MEKQSGLEGVLTMTPTVMKFIEEMMAKKRAEILGFMHPELRQIVELLLKHDDAMRGEDSSEHESEDYDPVREKALALNPPLPKNGFNI